MNQSKTSAPAATPLSRRAFLKQLGLTTAVGVVAAACSPAATPAPAQPTAAPAGAVKPPVVLKGANVTYLGGPWSFLPELDPVIDTFANDWAKQNGVNLNLIREGTNLPAKIQTAIETGSGANIIQSAQPTAVFAKSLADISDVVTYLDNEGGGYLPGGPNFCKVGGKWLGAPLGQNNWFINYREDWLKEEGLSKFPDTWDEALTLGKKLKAKGRPYGMTFSDKAGGDGNATPRMMLWAFGGKEFNPDGSLALDSKETIAALEFAIKLHNDAGDPGEVAYDDGANNANFLASKISMTANVNTIYLPALKSAPDVAKNMNHGIPPQGPGGRFTGIQLNWWGILGHTKGADLDAAKDLIKNFFSIKNLGAFFKAGQGYILPMLPKYENEPIWPADPKLAIAKEMFKLSRPPGYALAEQTKLSGLMIDKVIIGKLFSQACSTGNARAALDGVLKDIADLKLIS